MIDIQKVMKQLRTKTNMSMDEVALASGYTKATIHNVENGKRNGSFNTINDLAETYGYEIKLVKRGIYESDIIEWTKELPEEMTKDDSIDKYFAKEFGIPLRTDKMFLVKGQNGSVYSSRLYLFPDGQIENDGDYDSFPEEWMEMPRKED